MRARKSDRHRPKLSFTYCRDPGSPGSLLQLPDPLGGWARLHKHLPALLKREVIDRVDHEQDDRRRIWGATVEIPYSSADPHKPDEYRSRNRWLQGITNQSPTKKPNRPVESHLATLASRITRLTR